MKKAPEVYRKVGSGVKKVLARGVWRKKGGWRLLERSGHYTCSEAQNEGATSSCEQDAQQRSIRRNCCWVGGRARQGGWRVSGGDLHRGLDGWLAWLRRWAGLVGQHLGQAYWIGVLSVIMACCCKGCTQYQSKNTRNHVE